MNRQYVPDFQRSTSRKIINIPDIPGYITLKWDFHTHTVFSNGLVWPVVRINEAWKEGLDIIAITDHIEYLSHKDFYGDDLNKSLEIANAYDNKLLLIRGAEITKNKMPPGHLNALFIEDINKLKHEDPMIQIQEAVRQEGFIFWNHPGAQQVSSQWWEFHSILLEKGWLHGVEVASVKLHPPSGTTAMFAHSQDRGDPVKFKLLNCYSGSNHHPVVEINITCK